jgi:hypothetical protein
MTAIVSPRGRLSSLGLLQSIADAATAETLHDLSPLSLSEDFTGPGHAVPAAGSPSVGYAWVKKIVGAAPPTVAVVANAAGGVMACTLTADSQKQDAAIYTDDKLNFDMTKSAWIEFRIANQVLPTGNAQIVFGLQSAWIDGPDNASFYAQFSQSASGLVNLRTKDGVNTTSVSSGVTMVAGAYRIFRIDCTDPTNVRFFIDGAEVSGSQLSFAATGADAILQPYASVYKASGTGVGTLYIDRIAVGMKRS